jgi:hypothetical protein
MLINWIHFRNTEKREGGVFACMLNPDLNGFEGWMDKKT